MVGLWLLSAGGALTVTTTPFMGGGVQHMPWSAGVCKVGAWTELGEPGRSCVGVRPQRVPRSVVVVLWRLS